MIDIKTLELGQVVSGVEVGRANVRWMVVICRVIGTDKGCGERRWARYYGPHRHSPLSRLCRGCNTKQGARM